MPDTYPDDQIAKAIATAKAPNTSNLPGPIVQPYEPTWKDRIANLMLGNEKPSLERERFVEGLIGSRGLGSTGMSVSDFVPIVGQVLPAQEAVKQGDYKTAAMSLFPMEGSIAGQLAANEARALKGLAYETAQHGPFYRVNPRTTGEKGSIFNGIGEETWPSSPFDAPRGGSTSYGTSQYDPITGKTSPLMPTTENNVPLKAANKYVKSIGLPEFSQPEMPRSSLTKQSAIGRTFNLAAEGNPEYKSAIFDAYGRMMPDVVGKSGAQNYDQLLEAAYRQMAKETADQFDALPLRYSYHRAGEGNYKDSPQMVSDVHNNGHLFVYQGGDKHDFLHNIDPETGLNENEKFRAVHDSFGHAILGNTFGPQGEERAWAAHSRMYSPLAQLAMTAETRGQNSVVNYTPLNMKTFDQLGQIEMRLANAIKGGRTDEVAALKAEKTEAMKDWQFAPNKAVLLPPEFLSTEYAGGMPEYVRSLIKPETGTTFSSSLAHFSRDPSMTMTDPKLYGTGLKGAERDRIFGVPGGVKDRSYFYLGDPRRVSFEPGLGSQKYSSSSENLYNWNQDPAGLWSIAQELNRAPATAKNNPAWINMPQAINDVERLAKEYGYSGIANTKHRYPMAVTFDPTPVQRVGRKEGGRVGYATFGSVPDDDIMAAKDIARQLNLVYDSDPIVPTYGEQARAAGAGLHNYLANLPSTIAENWQRPQTVSPAALVRSRFTPQGQAEASRAVAGAAQAAAQPFESMVTASGRAYRNEISPEQMFPEAMNFASALTFGPMPLAGEAEANVLRMGMGPTAISDATQMELNELKQKIEEIQKSSRALRTKYEQAYAEHMAKRPSGSNRTSWSSDFYEQGKKNFPDYFDAQQNIDALKNKIAKIEKKQVSQQRENAISPLAEALEKNGDLINNAHKIQNISFKSLPVDVFNGAGQSNKDNPSLFLHKSPNYNKRQSSEYKLMMIDGKPAYARKSNHWGTFGTNIKDVDEAVKHLGISREEAESRQMDDPFGRIGTKYHNWSLTGGDEGTNTSQAGYVHLDDLDPIAKADGGGGRTGYATFGSVPKDDIMAAKDTARQLNLVTEDDAAGTWSPRSDPTRGQTVNSYSPTTETPPLGFRERLFNVLYNRFVQPAISAVTAPGRVYRGEVPEDQMIDEAKNMASQVMLGSFGFGVPSALRKGIDANVLRSGFGGAGMPRTIKLSDIAAANNMSSKELGQTFTNLKKTNTPYEDWSYETNNQRKMLPKPVFDVNQLKPGDVLQSFFGDRSPAGYNITTINGQKLDVPVTAEGGSDHALMNVNQETGSPLNRQSIWKSGNSVISSLVNRGKRGQAVSRFLGYDDPNVYGVHVAMGPHSQDFSTHTSEGLLGTLKQNPISEYDLDAFDHFMRVKNPYGKALEEFPGLRSQELRNYLLSTNNGAARIKFSKGMDQDYFRSKGFPEVGPARFATTHPELAAVPTYSAGHMVTHIDMSDPIEKEFTSSNRSYPTDLMGTALGKFATFPHKDVVFPDFSKTINENPPIRNVIPAKYKKYADSNAFQIVTPEYQDYLGNEVEKMLREGRNNGGRTLGNNAIDNAMRMATGGDAKSNFSQAFASARANYLTGNGPSTFNWKGKEYGVQVHGEKKLPSQAQPKRTTSTIGVDPTALHTMASDPVVRMGGTPATGNIEEFNLAGNADLNDIYNDDHPYVAKVKAEQSPEIFHERSPEPIHDDVSRINGPSLLDSETPIVIPHSLAEIYAQKHAADAVRLAKQTHKPTMDDVFSRKMSIIDGADPIAMPSNLDELVSYLRKHHAEGGRAHFGFGGESEFSGSRPESGGSGSVSAGRGNDIGSHESLNAAMGRESPAQRDVSYGGGGDRGGGGGGGGNRQPSAEQQSGMMGRGAGEGNGLQAAIGLPGGGVFGFAPRFDVGNYRTQIQGEQQNPKDIQDYTQQRLTSPYQGTYLTASMDPSNAFGMYRPDLVGVQNTRAGAAGFLGSGMGESGKGLDPSAINGGSIGMFQHTGPRAVALRNDLGIGQNLKGNELRDALAGTGMQQLGFALNEVQTKPEYAQTKYAMRTGTNAADAADVALTNFERPSLENQIKSAPSREAYAQGIMAGRPSGATMREGTYDVAPSSFADALKSGVDLANTQKSRFADTRSTLADLSQTDASNDPAITAARNAAASSISGSAADQQPSILDRIFGSTQDQIDKLASEGKYAGMDKDQYTAKFSPNDPNAVKERIIYDNGQPKVDYYTKDLSQALFGDPLKALGEGISGLFKPSASDNGFRSSVTQPSGQNTSPFDRSGRGQEAINEALAVATPLATAPVAPYTQELGTYNQQLPSVGGLTAQQWAAANTGGDMSRVHGRIKFVNGAPMLEYYTE